MHLCNKCDEAIHKIGKLKSHKRNAVGRAAAAPILCDMEDGQVASAHCAACGNINLCAKCDADKHKVKARAGHERTAPVPPATDGDTPAATAASVQPASAYNDTLTSKATATSQKLGKSRDDKRRHFVREEVLAVKALTGIDVLLTHEAPRPFYPAGTRIDAGKTALNDVLASMRPRLHLFGHHHEFTD